MATQLAPSLVLDLVERFERNRDEYTSGKYNEAQLRNEFLNPFFEALGWDVNNRQGYAEAYKDVIHEDAIRIGTATKAPDYCFRIGGTRKFFVEAKKPSVSVGTDISAAYQLRRYAWSAKLPLSILTDFDEFAVYDCRGKPMHSDKSSVGRIMYYQFGDYIPRWTELASILSREAVLKGSFDRYIETTKAKKGTTEVDDAFLAEIERWRDMLARNIALRNEKLTNRQLNQQVQRTIDRIIFLRICEDRGVEMYGRLQALMNGANVYSRLRQLFHEADDRYNSGLFHFREEKGRSESPDEVALKLAIDDKVLQDIIANLYYPESPYEFSVLPVEILGQVYEQFLGKVIRLTEGHRAKVEEKPEVRKAGGVYYTPSYIVDYIVKNTVGKLLEGSNSSSPQPSPSVSSPLIGSGSSIPSPLNGSRTSVPSPLNGRGKGEGDSELEKAKMRVTPMTPKEAAKLHILDPACGSGSFLLGAYQYLLNWHRDWYLKDGMQKHTKELYQAQGGEWRLTTQEKKRILLNNIFGVDIDSQAVEVTKLSLLLRVLEGESQETITRQLQLFQQRALPDLGSNIKCGNSLIGPDFYQGQQASLFDNEEERLRINTFDWQTEFPEIMKAGGFDVVIGNPPWGASFADEDLSYLRSKYHQVVVRMVDSYIYFTFRALQLAGQGKPVGFVIPSTLLNQSDAAAMRRILLDRGVRVLINMGQGVFGPKVLNTTTILVSQQLPANYGLLQADLSVAPRSEKRIALDNVGTTSWGAWKSAATGDALATFFVGDSSFTDLFARLRSEHAPLQRILTGEIQRGVSPDVAAAHIVRVVEARKLRLEEALLRPSVSGAQIKRYRPWKADQCIIYTSRDTEIKAFPRVLKHLEGYRQSNSCREVVKGKHPWWSLHRPRDSGIFRSPKFIGLTTSKTIELIYDASQSLFVTDAMYVFGVREDVEPLTCLAIMQSRLFLFLYRVANQGESRVIPQVKAAKLQTLPFPALGAKDKQSIAELVERMLDLHKQLPRAKTDLEKTAIERQIQATDRQIDVLVYELYGLTEDEIQVVEGTSG